VLLILIVMVAFDNLY